MNRDVRRAARAYIGHVDAILAELAAQGRPIVNVGRELLTYTNGYRSYVRDGRCRWCSHETETKRRVWHPVCARAYMVAKGLTVIVGHEAIPRGDCAVCGAEPCTIETVTGSSGAKSVRRTVAGFDIDHKLALGIAARLGDRRSVLRAWWLGNLQRVCRECHLSKTTRDRRVMALLDRGVSYEAALAEASAKHGALL